MTKPVDFIINNIILKHRKKVIAAVTALAVICLLITPLVPINYDVTQFLPDDADSTISLDVMNEEFSGGVPNARLMVYNITIPQALQLKKQIQEIDGVNEVLWLDDAVSVETPIEFSDKKTAETYYINNTALFTITIDENSENNAVSEIREVAGQHSAMDGLAVSDAYSGDMLITDLKKIMLIAVPIILLILLLTTTSWFEPLIFLFTIGIAIIINMGTNIFFGGISFITNGVAAILQLAVSMDYAIFILHRFAGFQKDGMNIKDAMANAMKSSIKPVFASGITTIAGFIALYAMSFKIGPDMASVMVKGVIISLLCVFILLPALTLSFYKAIEKTKHRVLIPDFRKFQELVIKFSPAALIILIVIAAPAYLAMQNNDYIYLDIYNDERSSLGQESHAIENVFGDSANLVMLVKNGNTANESLLVSAIESEPITNSVISYVGTVGAEIPHEYVPKDSLSKLVSENYSRIVVTLDARTEDPKAFEMVDYMRLLGDHYCGEGSCFIAGQAANVYDMVNSIETDNLKVNLIAIALVFLIIMFTFRSLSLPVILVLVIESAIWINCGIFYFQGIDVYYFGYLIISSVQLGATIDYAILFANTYVSSRKENTKRRSLEKTISTAAISILTSGTILCVCGTILWLISTNGLLSQVGLFLGRGAVLSTIAVLFVLPILMIISDKIIQKTSLHPDFKSDNEKVFENGY